MKPLLPRSSDDPAYKAGRRDYVFHCPGCRVGHQYVTQYPEGEKGPQWEMTGTMEKPTFTPSLLYKYTGFPTDEEHKRIMAGEKVVMKEKVCHLFVREGMIEFLSDCTHDLAGKTVPMVDYDARLKAIKSE